MKGDLMLTVKDYETQASFMNVMTNHDIVLYNRS